MKEKINKYLTFMHIELSHRGLFVFRITRASVRAHTNNIDNIVIYFILYTNY